MNRKVNRNLGSSVAARKEPERTVVPPPFEPKPGDYYYTRELHREREKGKD